MGTFPSFENWVFFLMASDFTTKHPDIGRVGFSVTVDTRNVHGVSRSKISPKCS